MLAGNFVLLIVGWAFVGFASYALISFWYRRTTATRAGMKAFVINVVGDIGLVLAAFLIFQQLGTFEYTEVFAKAPQVFHTNEWTVTAICLLLLVGAFAKSAQLPFHTWLPDAMEGPTPVSSLIHAATMVTAGVYLIARTHVLFVLAPTAADIAAFVGLATLLVAASIALVMTDLKRAIAYSTMSQIGYMIVGVSIGAYSAGMFHLMTHAFFKALLFMAAGSIIAAMANEQNIDKMSGFGKAMKFTSVTMLCGGLALAAFPLTSGFFSKDEILAYASARGGMYLIFTILGYFGALLTAIYTFRLIFRVLRGDPCAEAQHLIDTGHVVHAEAPFNPATGEAEDTDVGFPGEDHHIAEQSPPMKVAMGTLAFLALFAGFVQVPGVDKIVTNFLDPVFSDSPLATIEPSNTARLDRPRDRRGDQPRRDRHRLLPLRRQPGDAAPPAGALLQAAHLPLQQVVLRRGDRHPHRPPGAGDRSLRQQRLRALRHRRRRSPAAPRRRSAKPGRSSAPFQNGIVRTYGLFLVFGAVGLALYFLIQQS